MALTIPSACRKSQITNSTRWQTLRNGAEFRFLREGAVRWYCPRAKGGKRTKALQFVQIARLLNCFGGRSKPLPNNSYETVNFSVN